MHNTYLNIKENYFYVDAALKIIFHFRIFET